jgi:hypothetical protein
MRWQRQRKEEEDNSNIRGNVGQKEMKVEEAGTVKKMEGKERRRNCRRKQYS